MARERKPRVPEPYLRTPVEERNDVEHFKLEGKGVEGELEDDFRNVSASDISEGSEQLAKAHGIYLEFNRAKTGKEKEWIYMLRVTVPGGGPFTAEQWKVIDDISSRYTADKEGYPSVRFTTRQNIQFHWVRKEDVLPLVRELVTTGYSTLNGCGDNTRNVMAPPLSRHSKVFDAHAWAEAINDRFRIDMEPHLRVFAIDPNYVRKPEDEQQEQSKKSKGNGKKFNYGNEMLNRKFKIGVSGFYQDEDGTVRRDNSVEVLTNDVAVVPLLNEQEEVDRFQVFIGGGQGEKNNKPTFSALAQPLGIFAKEDLLEGLEAIVETHKEWGDRKNRHWARLKYVVHAQGMEWFREQLKEKGLQFEAPYEDLSPGPRYLYHGWHELPDGDLAYGTYIENGRLIDGQDGSLKSMVRDLMGQFDLELSITPNQDLLFTGIDPDQKEAFEQRMIAHGYGTRNGSPYSTLRKRSGSCVGLYTCRLAYAESEQFEPVLLDQLEEMGYGELHESVGITGCERQCFRPGTKSIGWVGSGPRHYSLKLGGAEDGSRQGTWFTDGEAWYLRKVPREQVARVTAALFDFYLENRSGPEESFGDFHGRLGNRPFIDHLSERPDTGDLLKRGMRAPFLTEQLQEVVQGEAAFKNGNSN